MKNIIESVKSSKKSKVFVFILLAIAMIGTLVSIIARFTFLSDDIQTRSRIAIVAPADDEAGNSFKQGAQLYIDTLNRQGGFNGRQLEYFVADETPGAAEKIAADSRVVAVVGHLKPGMLQDAASVYERRHLPVVTPLFLQKPLAGVTSLGLDSKEQARFIANYARNIQQQRLMYVVREAGAEFDSLVEPFLDVYTRFDIPVKQVWSIANNADSETQLRETLEEIKKIDIGAVYIAASPGLAARIVKGIRETGNALELYAPAQLASNAFTNGLAAVAGTGAGGLTHGMIAATPVLFDTANEKAQIFQNSYQKNFGRSPDWVAAYAYDAAGIALSAKPGASEVKGITGAINFIDGQAQIPMQMGVYNGERLISAPIQLLPIAKGANFNYIEALRQGRVLYANDHFMFKTNVVYVGVNINEITDLDLQKETATLDMSIWFRYRGNFAPQDLEISNAVQPVKLENAEESKESDEVQYRRYRIRQAFKLNFTDAKRAYGQHIVGVGFRHRQLNNNNLMYVVDVLGMPTGNALSADLRNRKVVASNTGWEVDNAWESQDVVLENGKGDLQYLGMSGERPVFSKITLGVLLKPATANARDIVSSEYFIYFAIFGVIGAFFAIAMDVRQWGRYWAFHSWVLRLVFWPLLLLSLGNLILDWAFMHLSPSSTRTFVVVYESLWWLLGAWLLDMGVRRFIWEPLALRAYGVPNVIKLLASLVIFSFAISIILSVVFNQSLTSLLATSGVLAMVVGLAVKDIIANVFSGIILNIERPFKVGDFIKINKVSGQVKDINWRTTRIESSDGQMICLANAKVSEAFMENFSLTPNGVSDEVHFYTKTDTDPLIVQEIIKEALFKFCNSVPDNEPKVRYKGIVNVEGSWVADFAAGYRVVSASKKSSVKEELSLYVRQKFLENDIPLVPVG